MKNSLTILASIAIAQAAGLIGSFLTFAAIPAWYSTLVKPSFSPPDWVFGPAWITLYTMMGIASFLIWKTNKQEQTKKMVMFATKLNASIWFLNRAW